MGIKCVNPDASPDGMPKDRFGKNRAQKDGLQTQCICCTNEHNKRRKGYECEFSSGVYKIVDTHNSDEIVWIGKSTGLSRRWYVHLGGVKTSQRQFLGRPATKKEISRYKFIPWYNIDNRLMMKLREIALIEKHQPKFNITHKHG